MTHWEVDMSLADSHGLLAASFTAAGVSAFVALSLDGTPLFEPMMAVTLGAAATAAWAAWRFLGAWEGLAREAEHGRDEL